METGKAVTLICQPLDKLDIVKYSWYQENKWLNTSVNNTVTVATDGSLSSDVSDLYLIRRPNPTISGNMSLLYIKSGMIFFVFTVCKVNMVFNVHRNHKAY